MRRANHLATLCAGLLALSALVACERLADPMPAPLAPAPAAPRPPSAPELAAAPRPTPSQESEALATYYRRLEADLLSQGLLRGDGGEDAPFTDTMLARDFVEIALRDEFAPDSATVAAEPGPSRLRRWEDPIRLGLEFGGTVSEAVEARDRASLDAYAARLSRLTGVPISRADEGANFRVLVLGEDDREGVGARLEEIAPGIAPSLVRDIVNLPRSTLCLVFASQAEASGAYDRAVVLIRAELPGLLRTACIHEELAQGMGLVNDSPQARPSIFNDNDEFGRLTGHDEMLLRILYDPRLRTGMTAEDAEPIVRQIAAEMVGGGPA